MSDLASRRTFLALGAAFGASRAFAARTSPQPFFQRHDLPMGLQLYTVAAALKEDLIGGLNALRQMGYQTVELAGLLGKSPDEWQSALQASGLRCPAAHFSPRPLSPGPSLRDDVHSIAELAHRLGFETVVCSLFLIPDRMELKPNAGEGLAEMLARLAAQLTEQDWRDMAEYLNAKGAALKAVGLRFGYHNHNNEFAPVGGTTGMAILMKETDPRLVSYEMDAGWVASAGIDPLTLLARYPGRFSGMHIKDIKASTNPNYAFKLDPTEVGQGTIDWSTLLTRAYAANIRQFYVEQEQPFHKPPLEEAVACIEFLRGVV
jgi:sugar phosphate isomerase/epimerase